MELEPAPREDDHLLRQEQVERAERSLGRWLPGEVVESEVVLPRRLTRLREKPEQLVYS